MRTKGIILLGALSLAFLAACQDSDNDVPATHQGDLANVAFEIDASPISRSAATRTFTPQYSLTGFSVYAYKKSGSDYIFSKSISLANMTYDANTKKLTGADNLEIGTYKFVPAYGIVNQTSVITPPVWTGSTLNDNLELTFNGNSSLGEVFLDTGNDVGNLKEYELGLTEGANQTVTATLKRAVARVDIMFISAIRLEDGTYVEKEYFDASSNVFGGKTLDQLQLRFTGINNEMNLFGVDTTTEVFDKNFSLGNFSETLTIGTGTSTLVGKDTYTNYDNIQQNDIIRGSAHVFGTYLFPSLEPAAGLQLYIKPTVGDGRTITVSRKGDTILPIEQNKVTLVKIYILNDNNVFSTTVDFEIEIDTVWEGAYEVYTGIN